jgi:hypothetical protein
VNTDLPRRPRPVSRVHHVNPSNWKCD